MPRHTTRGLPVLVFAAILASLASIAAAEPIPAITVRPSGVEVAPEPEPDKLELLRRRFEQKEYAFRHICSACGLGQGAPGAGRSFEPIATLSARRGATAQTETPIPAPLDNAQSIGDAPGAPRAD